MTQPSPPAQTEGEQPDRTAAWRAALYTLAAAVVALLAALGLLAPEVTPRVLDVAGAAIALVSLSIATWTNPAVRSARSGRHARE